MSFPLQMHAYHLPPKKQTQGLLGSATGSGLPPRRRTQAEKTAGDNGDPESTELGTALKEMFPRDRQKRKVPRGVADGIPEIVAPRA
jgi:hypothetical protein